MLFWYKCLRLLHLLIFHKFLEFFKRILRLEIYSVFKISDGINTRSLIRPIFLECKIASELCLKKQQGTPFDSILCNTSAALSLFLAYTSLIYTAWICFGKWETIAS